MKKKYLYASGAFVAVGCFAASVVFATQLYAVPFWDGDMQDFSPSESTQYHYTLVDEDIVCNGDTDYIYSNANGAEESFYTLVIPPGTSSTTLTVYACARSTLRTVPFKLFYTSSTPQSIKMYSDKAYATNNYQWFSKQFGVNFSYTTTTTYLQIGVRSESSKRLHVSAMTAWLE